MPPTQKMVHTHAMAADAIRWPGHAQPMAGSVPPVEELLDRYARAQRDAARAECQVLREHVKCAETERAAAWGKWITLAAQHESACDLIRWQQDRIAQLTADLDIARASEQYWQEDAAELRDPGPAPAEDPLLRATRSGNRQIIGIPLP